MPTYEFECADCGHTMDVWMTFSDYEACGGVVECPECGGTMHRKYSGRQNAPAIKTEMRLEDYWKKNNILDPEDPEYAKRSMERVKAMREKAKKEKEIELEKLGDKAKRRRINFKPDTRSIDELPDSHKGRVSVDKPKKDE